MQYQVKLLRRAGARLSEEEIRALPWVVAEVVTSNAPGGKRLCLFPLKVNLLLHPAPHRELFKVALGVIDRESTTYLGFEQRLLGDGRLAAVAQEWKMTRVSMPPGGWSEARENGITDDLAALGS